MEMTKSHDECLVDEEHDPEEDEDDEEDDRKEGSTLNARIQEH